MTAASPTPPPRKAFLVGLALGSHPVWEAEEHLDELAELAASAGAEVVGRAIQRRPSPDPALFIGRGKAEEIAKEAAAAGASLILFDDELSGSQTKNLAETMKLPVVDRSALILEIFQQRARSREALTQVELARLRYMLPRLTRAWTHLSRQGGGIGMRGGEGESQLEADRRALRQRISRLERELETIVRTRKVQRQRRTEVPVVALVGYTNAGKSTLFNALTRDETLTENRLFATLDARMRRAELGPGAFAVIADTVGFIRKLPHHLVASFRSTLEESARADVVVHVVDRSHPSWESQTEVSVAVLEELGVDRHRLLTVWNKADRVAPIERSSIASANPADGLWVSALTGEGLPALRLELLNRLARPQPSLLPAAG